MINDPVISRKPASQQERVSDEGAQPLVVVVDDDMAVREAVQELMMSAGMECVSFASTQDMLKTGVLERPGCLVLDIRMPGVSGLDLQRHLAASDNPKPIVFLTGYGDIPMSVQAMKAGAIDFLTKPVRDQTLLDAVIAGIKRDVMQRNDAQVMKTNVARLETLTPRERQVLHEVARGRVNKQIAFDLGISEVTVKLHRSNVMRKMRACSLGELIRMWEVLPIPMREACAATR